MLKSQRLAVVIPAYNVADHVETVLTNIPEFVDRIIVVDDASRDDTAARVESLSTSRVTLLRHPENRGVGAAMQTGFAEALRAGIDVVVKMDGDDQMDPSYLKALLEPVLTGQADMTKGNRYASLESLQGMPLIRAFGNAGLTFLVKLASGYWNLFDAANGYLAIRAGLLEHIRYRRLPSRFFFESGLLVEAGIHRAVVEDVAIPARYGNQSSSLSIGRVLLLFPPRLLWGLVRRVFWRYFVHDFTALSVLLMIGIPFLLWGTVFGAFVWQQMQAINEYTPPGLVMLAALPVILGVQFILQALVLDISNVPKIPLTRPPGTSLPDQQTHQ